MFQKVIGLVTLLSFFVLTPALCGAQAAPAAGAPQRADQPPAYVTEVPAPNEKYSVVALLLEIFPSFGAGHYYAGNIWWGVAGTLSNVAILLGLIMGMGSGGDSYTIPKTIAITGTIGKLVTLVGAPVVTYMDNKRKRRDYNRMRGQVHLVPLFQPLERGWAIENPARFSPFTARSVHRRTLVFPVLHFAF